MSIWVSLLSKGINPSQSAWFMIMIPSSSSEASLRSLRERSLYIVESDATDERGAADEVDFDIALVGWRTVIRVFSELLWIFCALVERGIGTKREGFDCLSIGRNVNSLSSHQISFSKKFFFSQLFKNLKINYSETLHKIMSI